MSFVRVRALDAPVRSRYALGAAALLLAFLVSVPAAAAQSSVELRAPARGSLDTPLVVEVVAHGATVAAWEAALGVDAGAAELARFELPGATTGTGALGPVVQGDRVHIGAYGCAVARCLSGNASVALQRTHDGVLARIMLLPHRQGRLVLRLGGLRLVDRAGRVQTLRARAVSVQVGPGRTVNAAPAAQRVGRGAAHARRPIDFTGDRRVDDGDIMEVGLAWSQTRLNGSPCRIAGYATRDVNADGCIDVADVQAVARGLSSAAAPRVLKAPPLTLVVTSDGDQPDAAINRVCDTGAGVCTLRAAIQEANANTGTDRIEFNIPGGGTRTIQVNAALPSLADNSGGTTIDGYTQPGASVNTAALTSNAQIRVQIRGAGYTTAYKALSIFSHDNVIRGLAFFNVQSIGLAGANSHHNRILGSFVGTDATGTVASALFVHLCNGIDIANGAHDNVIGTPVLADRNVISGNAFTGVYTLAVGTNANVIQNNIIGLNPSATDRLRNQRMGVDINLGSSSNIVGGLGAGEGNVLSGNTGGGVEISHPGGTSFNRVLGNVIGTDPTGITEPPYTHNSGEGIHIEDTANNSEIRGNVIGGNFGGGIRVDGTSTRFNTIADNLIGVGRTGIPMGNDLWGISFELHARDATVANNTIAFSPVGIQLLLNDADSIRITRNSIYGNTGLGIDLAPIGAVNPNDPGDVDTGPNQGQNFPIIDPASTNTVVSGTSCAGCTVEVFRADAPAGDFGEGRTFLGSAIAAGDGTFAVPVAGLFGGDVVTSTATDAAGNTSEFGQNVALVGPPPPPPPSSASDAFNRVVVDGWGSADSGGAWTVGSAPADYDVNGSAGTIVVPVAGNSGFRFAFLGDVFVANADIAGSISPDRMATGSSAYAGFMARRQASGQEYRFRVRLSNSGSVSLQAAVGNGVGETFIGSEVNAGFTYTGGTVIRVRVQATGASPTTLRMKAWPNGQPEPAGFQYTATDSTAALQGAGSVGVWGRLSSSATSVPTVLSFDDFLVAP